MRFREKDIFLSHLRLMSLAQTGMTGSRFYLVLAGVWENWLNQLVLQRLGEHKFMDPDLFRKKLEIIKMGIYRVAVKVSAWGYVVYYRNLSEPFTHHELMRMSRTPFSYSVLFSALTMFLTDHTGDAVHVIPVGIPSSGKTTIMWALLQYLADQYRGIKIQIVEGVPEALNFLLFIPNSEHYILSPEYEEAVQDIEFLYRANPYIAVIGELLGRRDFKMFEIIAGGLTSLTTLHVTNPKELIPRIRSYDVMPETFNRTVWVQTHREELPDGSVLRYVRDLWGTSTDIRRSERVVVNGKSIGDLMKAEAESEEKLREVLRSIDPSLSADMPEEVAKLFLRALEKAAGVG